MFGELDKNTFGFDVATMEDISCQLFAGGDKPSDISEEQTSEHPYPVYSNGVINDGLLCFSKSYRVDQAALTVSARGTIGLCLIRKPLFTPVVRLIALVPNDSVNIVYLKQYIDMIEIESTGTSQGQLTVPNFKRIPVLVPPIELQNQYASFVEQTDKSKFDNMQYIMSKQILRSLVNKYYLHGGALDV